MCSRDFHRTSNAPKHIRIFRTSCASANIRSLLGGDTIVVKKIQVDAPNIAYESKDGVSNFDTIMANAKKSETEDQAKKAEGNEAKKPAKNKTKMILIKFIVIVT